MIKSNANMALELCKLTETGSNLEKAKWAIKICLGHTVY